MTSSIEVIILPRARQDIRNILQYTFDTWGSAQRDAYRDILERAFERLRVYPDLGHPAYGKPVGVRTLHLAHHNIHYRRELNRVVSPRRGQR
jgi:plasmid stabilization system protein ParE